LGRTWFLDTVCTLYYHLVPRRAESDGVFCHLMKPYVTCHVL
jgi:hypothetical protein